MTLPIAIASTPQDVFQFSHWLNKEIPEAIPLTPNLLPLSQINLRLFEKRIPICTASISAIEHVLDDYLLLPIGMIFSRGDGPKVIAREPFSISELEKKKLALNGMDSTEHLLLKLLCPPPFYKQFCTENEALFLLQKGAVDCCLINPANDPLLMNSINGFHVVADLGLLWEEHYHLPLPLTGIAVKRSLGNAYLQKIIQTLETSIKSSWDDLVPAEAYVHKHLHKYSANEIHQYIMRYVPRENFMITTEEISAIDLLWRLAIEHRFLPPHHSQWLLAPDTKQS